jgi:hypothetical protein
MQRNIFFDMGLQNYLISNLTSEQKLDILFKHYLNDSKAKEIKEMSEKTRRTS